MSHQYDTIDRAGIFRARPMSWQVRRAESGAVAINLRFEILSMLEADGETWHDWSQYGQYQVFGDYYVVKKNGQVNETTVRQLSESLGWRGQLSEVVRSQPPDVVVQIKVDEDNYQGKIRFKAGWMNPGDFVPTMGGADAETVNGLDAQFGSLLRAAATSAPKPAGKPSGKPAAPKKQAKPTGPDVTSVPWDELSKTPHPSTSTDDTPFP